MEIHNEHQLTEEQNLRLHELEKEIASNPELFTRFHRVTQGHQPFSSRLIEYVCVHYSRTHGSKYPVKIGSKDVQFRLHESYNEWLDYWKKRNFDIYTRKYTMKYRFLDGAMYKTNVAQLNFVYWMMLHNVDNFIISQIDDIRTQKKTSSSESRKRKQAPKRRFNSAPTPPSKPLLSRQPDSGDIPPLMLGPTESS